MGGLSIDSRMLEESQSPRAPGNDVRETLTVTRRIGKERDAFRAAAAVAVVVVGCYINCN